MSSSPFAIAREAGTSQPERRPRRRRLSASHILIALAALLAFVLNYLALQDRDAKALVAVSASHLPAGSIFDPSSVEMVPVDSDFPGLDSLLVQDELAAFEGWQLTRAVDSGAVIDASLFAAPSTPESFRSMSIPIDVSHAAGGLLTPSDRIDVISVGDGEASYVAAGVEVLSVADLDSSAFGSPGGYFVVVGVDAEQALRIAQALEGGSIELIKSTGAPPLAETDGWFDDS